jgi:hypothetical protein
MKTVFFLFSTIFYTYSYCQSWEPLSTGVSSSIGAQSYVDCLLEYNGNLIVGGAFSNAGGNFANNIASWDGTTWSTLGSGVIGPAIAVIGCDGIGAIGSSYGYVSSMAIFNNELYVGGYFNNAGGVSVSNIAKWDGTNWSDVGGGMTGVSLSYQSTVKSLAVYNNELYASGTFDSAGGIPALRLAKWDGVSWSAVGTGLTTTTDFGEAMSMIEFNSNLYIGGNIASAGGVPVNNIAKWDGSNFSSLGTGIPLSWGILGVLTLGVYNNELYAGNPTTGISKWNGTSWGSVGGGLSSIITGAWTTTNYNGELIVGGSFGSAGPLTLVGNISSWDGANWGRVGPNYGTAGLSGLQIGGDLCVSSTIVFNGELYVGGSIYTGNNFDGPSVDLNGITRLTGVSEIDEIVNQSTHKIFPNPTVEFINIQLSEDEIGEEITIHSILGEKVYSNSFTDQICVSEFAPGTYIVQVTTNLGTTQSSIVIEK